MAAAAVAAAALMAAVAVFCALDPLRWSIMADFPDFETFAVDLPPRSAHPPERDAGERLTSAEVKFLGQVQGPESIVFDPLGRGPYTGVADGRVIFWNGTAWSLFALTSPNWTEAACGPQPTPMGYLKNEHICGRPLGLRFDRRTGDLYIADAYFGLLKVGPAGGLAVSLATAAEGVPFRFTNDLDLDDEGNVYFTDSNTKYQRRNFMQYVFTAEPTGRLLKYDPRTGDTTVLVRNIQFANGVSLSKDKSFLVFCEGLLERLNRYWLKGEKAGTSELFAVLPGPPDNVRTNEKGEFWVAIHCRRSLAAEITHRHPKFRKFFLKLPIPARYQYLMHIGGHPHALIMKYSEDGQVLDVLEDTKGKVVRSVSEVEEKDGKLWLGSVLMPFIAVY